MDLFTQRVQLYPHKKKLLPLLVKRAGEARYVYNWAMETLVKDGVQGYNSLNDFIEKLSSAKPEFLPESYSYEHEQVMIEAWEAYHKGNVVFKKRKEAESFLLPYGTMIKDKRLYVPDVGKVLIRGGKYHRMGKPVSFRVIHEDYKWYVEVKEEKDERLDKIRELQGWHADTKSGRAFTASQQECASSNVRT